MRESSRLNQIIGVTSLALCILYTSKQKKKNLNKFSINVGQHVIPYSYSTKYLGIVFDQDLKWQNQINSILWKLANATRILSKVKHFVNKSILVKLYYSFVYPHLKYSIVAWGNTKKTILHKLQVAQNKIIRNINFKSINDCIKMNTYQWRTQKFVKGGVLEPKTRLL